MLLIKYITDADYGCEEREPGEEKKVLVVLEDDNHMEIELEVEEKYLEENDLFEGCEWPEEIVIDDGNSEKYKQQMEWMEGYLKDLEDLEEGE